LLDKGRHKDQADKPVGFRLHCYSNGHTVWDSLAHSAKMFGHFCENFFKKIRKLADI
jgi:hypothetical protein